MSNDDWFNNLGGGMGEDPSKLLEKQLEAIKNSKAPAHKQISSIMKLIAPQITRFRMNGGDAQVQMFAQMAKMQLDSVGSDPFVTEDISKAIKEKADKSKIREALRSVAASRAVYSDALKMAKEQKASLKEMTDDEYVTATMAIVNILPPGFKKVAFASAGVSDEAGFEKNVRKERNKARKMSEEDLAREHMKAGMAFPLDEATDAVYYMSQKATPENLATLFNHVSSNLTEDQLADLAISGMDFIEEVGAAAGKGKHMSVEDPSRAAPFGENLKHLLTVFEEAVEAADMKPNVDLVAAYERNKANVDAMFGDSGSNEKKGKKKNKGNKGPSL